MAISFYNPPKTDFPPKRILKSTIKAVAELHGFRVGELNYVFVADEELLEMNRQYLQHDYFTDIITFDNSEEENTVEGDIFISIDRVRENGAALASNILEEYVRVAGHGLLHLLGFGDKTSVEQKKMWEMESDFIQTYKELITCQTGN